MRKHGSVIGCQDTSDPGHFGPKTFRHHEIGAEMSGQIGTSAKLSRGHFGTGTELSRPPANIFATVGRTEERFNITRSLLKRTTDFMVIQYTRIHAQH